MLDDVLNSQMEESFRSPSFIYFPTRDLDSDIVSQDCIVTSQCTLIGSQVRYLMFGPCHG